MRHSFLKSIPLIHPFVYHNSYSLADAIKNVVPFSKLYEKEYI